MSRNWLRGVAGEWKIGRYPSILVPHQCLLDPTADAAARLNLRWSSPILFRLLILFFVAGSITEGAAPSEEMQVGINLNRISDYNPSWVFTDAMKQSRPWISFAYNTVTGEEKWGGGGAIEVDAGQWPAQLRSWQNEQGQLMRQRAGTLIFREIGTRYPGGIYRAEWRGKGRIEFGFAARAVRRGTRDDGTSFADVAVTPRDSGILVKIVESDRRDPIRSLELWMPPHAGQALPTESWDANSPFSPFHPLFVQRLAPFNTIRFVDWTATNWSTPHTWEQRTGVRERQSGDDNGKGVALEYVIALANQLDKHVWINMPHWADDNYVRNMARLFRDSLDEKLTIYVEWSNELWNYAPGFAAHPWLKEQLELPEHAGKSIWRLAAENIRQDLAVWTDVFADQPERLVRVVAGQAANPWIAQELARHVGVNHIDAIAASAYVQLTQTQRDSFGTTTTADDVINAALKNLVRVNKELTAHRQLADALSELAGREIQLVAYEGGQHLDARGREVPYLSALYEAQTHQRMETLYERLLEIGSRLNLRLMNHYAYVGRNSRHGSWGALTYQNQPLHDAPKYRALLAKIKAE